MGISHLRRECWERFRCIDRQCTLFALYACAEAVGGEASTIEDLGEGSDNVERYRKTVQPLATVQRVFGEAVLFLFSLCFGDFPCLFMFRLLD